MASYSEIKNRVKKYGLKDEEEEKKEGYSGSEAYEKIKARVKNGGIAYDSVDEDYINNFISDANKFVSSAEEDYKNVGYSNAASSYDSRFQSWVDLNDRSSTIRAWLNSHKGSIDENTYNDIISSLDSFKTNSSNINNAFEQSKRYYSQWESEDDYNKAVEAQKDYDKKASEDLFSLWGDITYLRKEKDEYANTKEKWFEAQRNGDTESAKKYEQQLNDFLTAYGAKNEGEFLSVLDGDLKEKEKYFKEAQRIQNGIKLRDDALNAVDFKEYSQIGEDIKNPSVKDALGKVEITNPFTGKKHRIGAEDIKNIATFARDNPEFFMDDAKGMQYTYMNAQEISIYNYYLGKGDTESANAYLESIDATLKQRYGERLAGTMQSLNLEWLASISAGLDQFATGVRGLDNFFTGDESITNPSATQIASSIIREDIGDGFWGTMYDLGTTTANMLPSVLIGHLNPVAGLATMGASVAGNAYTEMINLGYNKDQARAYTIAVTAAEVGLQKLLGGITSLGGKLPQGITGAILKHVDNGLARTAIKLGGNMLSEGVEEAVQSVLEPLFKSITTGDNYNVDWGEVVYSGLLGALSAGALEGGSTIKGELAVRKTGKNFKEQGGNISKLKSFATNENYFSADTVAYQLANKVNENTGAYTIGRLLQEVDGTISEQNKADIIAGLESKGITSKTAEKLAEQYQSFVNGEVELSQAGIDIYENLDPLNNILRNDIIGKNTTVYQRTHEYADILNFANEVSNGTANATQNATLPLNAPLSNDEIARRINVAENSVAENPNLHINNPNKGKTTYHGNEVKIEGINSIKDGEVFVHLNTGEDVSTREIAFANEDEGLVYEAIADMNPDTAKAMIEGFNGGDLGNGKSLSLAQYVRGFDEAYKYGSKGIPASEMSKYGFSIDLTEEQRKIAYNRGKIDSVTEVKAQQEGVDTKVAKAKESAKTANTPKNKGGKVYFGKYADKAVIKDEDSIRGMSVKTVRALSEMLGRDFVFIESYVENGKRVYKDDEGNVQHAPNGMYDKDTGVIYIDLNAGASGEGLILNTVGHELTHFIRQWSPAKFKVFADVLFESYGQLRKLNPEKLSLQQLIAKQLKKGRENGNKDMTLDEAYEEVVADFCEAMLTDTNALETIAKIKQKDKGLFNKIKAFFRNLLQKFFKIADRHYTPDSYEGQSFIEMKKLGNTIERLANLWVDALVDAGESYSEVRNVLGEGASIKVNEKGEFLLGTAVDGKILYNERTWSEGGRQALEATLRVEGFSEEDINAALTVMDGKHELVERLGKQIAEQDRINKATLTTDLKTGKAVLSALVSNGDYPVNIDLLMVCKKRQAYQAVINRLCEMGMMEQATLDSLAIAEINKILGKNGFETACLGCFVESRRIRIQEWAETICSEWNGIVDKLVGEGKAKAFGFAKDTFVKDLTNKEIDKLSNDLESAYERDALNYGKTTVVKKMEQLLTEVPSLRKHLSVSDLITPQGRTKIKSLSTELNSLIACRYGSNTPKIVQDFNPYNHELAKYGKVPQAYSSLREYLYAIGGARMQSFSDFIVENWFDYCQIVADLSARKLPMHTYTKEIALVKLFGLTGIKINMSLIPDIDKSMGKEFAGLTRNEKGELVYIWGDKDRYKATGGKSYMQSINFADAVALQNDSRYSANVGTIAVGVSDAHIRMMLSDPRIRMIIPYHSSGMNPIFAKLVGTEFYNDYTNFQNTTVKYLLDKNGKKVNIKLEKSQKDNLASGFEFNKHLQELGDARATAQAYLDWCADASQHSIEIKGETYNAVLTPKFEQFSTGEGSENYYKLLEDFNTYDSITEKPAPQGDVQQIYPEDFEAILEAELNSRENYRKKQEPKWEATMDEIVEYLEKHTSAETLQYVKDNKIKMSANEMKKLREKAKNVVNSERVTDKETLDFLNGQIEKGEYITTYKSMRLDDGKLHSPMAAEINGKFENEYELGQWYQAVEHPELIKFDKKNGKPYFELDKGVDEFGDDLGKVPARYNPYEHSSNYVINDQFKTAFKRRNLVVVEIRIPLSETTSGYQAQYAKDAVGWQEWKKGDVASALAKKGKERMVFLSRWAMPVRILSDAEVAKQYKELLSGTGVTVPNNVVTPSLLTALENEGVAIDYNGIKRFEDLYAEKAKEREAKKAQKKAQKKGIKYSNRDRAPIFYSQMSKVVEGMKQEKFAANSVVSMLRGRGVKAEEIRWSGIVTFLEGKKSVTKQELLDFINNSMLQIGEKEIGGDGKQELWDNFYRQMRIVIPYFSIEEIEEMCFDYDGDFIVEKFQTELEAYVEDGTISELAYEEAVEYAEELSEALNSEGTRWSQYKLDGGTNYRELVFTMPNATYTNRAMKGHWGQDAEGVLVHARIQDFKTANGKRMLFIEEIQSDWHNEGHSKGYSTKEYEDAVENHDALYDKYKKLDLAFHKYVRSNDFMTDTEDVRKKKSDWLRGKAETAQKKYLEAEKVVTSLKEKGAGDTPDAPFKDTYHEYVLKRLLRMAAEEGYDCIGWTPAYMQEERWSEDYAEGYRIEYDQDMPKFLKKYGRQWGAKVEREGDFIWQSDGYGTDEAVSVWSMDITDSMKDSVLHEGQMMYSLREIEGESGTNYGIGVYLDSELLSNLTESERIQMVKEYVKELGGSVFTAFDSNHNAVSVHIAETKQRFKNKSGKKVSVNKDLTQKHIKNEVKQESIALIDELILTSKPNGKKPSTHSHGWLDNYGKNDWEYWTTYIQDKENTIWEATLNIATTANGEKVLYDIDPIKMVEQSIKLDTSTTIKTGRSVESDTIPIDGSITHSKPNVNQKTDVFGNSFTKSERETDSLSNRSLLANALDSVAQNEIEKNKLALYKEKISLIESEERKLHEIRGEIKEQLFTKGKRDTERLKELRFEEKQTANRINTYDRQLLTLEASKPLKNVLEREKQLAYKKAEKLGKEALSEYKEKTAKTTREMLTRWQESRKKGIESRHKTDMRGKIKKVVEQLNTLLTNPTKDKHIKEELRVAVADALDAINMDTVGAEERIANLKEDLMRAKTPEKIQEISRKIDHIELMGDRLSDKLTALKEVYQKIKDSSDPDINGVYQEAVYNMISNTRDFVGDTSIRDMSLEQLEAVYDMYSAILHTVRNANKMFKSMQRETVTKTAEAVGDEIRSLHPKEKFLRSKLSIWLRKIGWTLLKPFTAFRIIGSDTLTGLYTELRNGEDVYYGDIKAGKNFLQGQYEKHNYKSWDKKLTKTFKSKSGKEFTLNLEQMMAIYAYSRREQAIKHILEGGIVLKGNVIKKKNKLGITVGYEVDTDTAFNISEETLKDICDSLTNEQKGFVNEMQAYLSDVMGAKGNDVSMKLYGVKLFKEEFYFPIRSSKEYLDIKVESPAEIKLKNSSFSKTTIQHANNPVVLNDFSDVWANHVHEMSMYHAFVLPLEDFTRVYNYRTSSGDLVETMSTKEVIGNAYGDGAKKYIVNFLKSLNGGVRIDSVGMEKFMSLFKKGAVFGSASVAIQQPSAVMRAMALINPKYFVVSTPKSLNLLKHKQDWEELKKYAPIAGIKEMGRFDVGMGQDTVKWLKDQNTFMEKADDVLSKTPAFMDEVTWVSIWNAVKKEVAAKSGLKVGTEEYLKRCGERFTEVISLTQVYDSVFARSDIMRNANPIAKMLTAFMAEPTTALNMLVDAFIQGKRTGNFGGFAKIVGGNAGAVVSAIVFNSALKSIITAMRDDDDDESYTEKYIGAFVGNLKDEINPLGYIPFVKDIVSIFEGYDVERMDMALFSDLKSAMDAFDSDSKTEYEKWTGLVGAVSAFFGVPFKNVERDIRGAYNTIKSFIEGEKTTDAGIDIAIKEAWTGEEISNAQQLYDAIIRGDREHIERVKGRFEDQDEIDTAIRTALRKNDSRIREAARARYDGDIAEYMRIAREIIAEGKFKQDYVVGAINAEISAIKREEETETPENPTGDKKDEVTSIYSTSDINVAFENGDTAMAKEVIADLIKTKVANGKTEKEAQSSLRSAMTSYWKPRYKEANDTERYRIRQILLTSGLYGGANDVVKTCQQWLKD